MPTQRCANPVHGNRGRTRRGPFAHRHRGRPGRGVDGGARQPPHGSFPAADVRRCAAQRVQQSVCRRRPSPPRRGARTPRRAAARVDCGQPEHESGVLAFERLDFDPLRPALPPRQWTWRQRRGPMPPGPSRLRGRHVDRLRRRARPRRRGLQRRRRRLRCPHRRRSRPCLRRRDRRLRAG